MIRVVLIIMMFEFNHDQKKTFAFQTTEYMEPHTENDLTNGMSEVNDRTSPYL